MYLSRLDFPRVLLGQVAQRVNVLLAEGGVVVKVDLGVANHHSSIGCFGERIDFHQSAVESPEHFVELSHQRLTLIKALGPRGESEGGREVNALRLGNPLHNVDWLGEDELGSCRSDIFNRCSACWRGDEHGTPSGSVKDDLQ